MASQVGSITAVGKDFVANIAIYLVLSSKREVIPHVACFLS
jgi:hypothetical protein